MEYNFSNFSLVFLQLFKTNTTGRKRFLFVSEIGRLMKQRDKFQRQFLQWAYTRKRTRDLLRKFVTAKLRRGSPLAKMAATALAATAVAASAAFTFGASIAVGAAAAVGAGAREYMEYSKEEIQKEAREAISQDMNACQELQKMVDSFKQCVTDFAVFCREHTDLVLSSELVKYEFGFLLDILRGTNLEELRAEVQRPTLPALLTLLEEENIHFARVNTFTRQLQSPTLTNDGVSPIIRQILAEVRECPNEKEIQMMVVNFIKEIFDTKLSSSGFSRERRGYRPPRIRTVTHSFPIV